MKAGQGEPPQGGDGSRRLVRSESTRASGLTEDAAVTCKSDGNEEPLCNTNSLNVFVLPFLSEAAQGSPSWTGAQSSASSWGAPVLTQCKRRCL